MGSIGVSSNPEPAVASDLVSRIQQGDMLAEKHMIQRYQRGLMYALRRKANGDNTIADDVCQETWRIVIEKVRDGAIRQPDKLAAFIIQTGNNQLIMYFRRNPSTKVDEFSEQASSEDKNPSQNYERERNGKLVRKLLKELGTQRDREILTRFYLQEHDKNEICKDLELSDLHFNRVLFRAKQRLKKYIEEQYGEFP